jgi:hypothetical protein
LEEIGGLGIVRCIGHRDLSDGSKNRHSNYYFTFPAGNRWSANKTFVEKHFKRWNEYPNFQSDGAYHTLHLYKTAVEKANKLTGGWPDEEAVISELEGMYFATAGGYRSYGQNIGTT